LDLIRKLKDLENDKNNLEVF